MLSAQEAELKLICASANTRNAVVTDRIMALFSVKGAQCSAFERLVVGDPAKAIHFRWVIGPKNRSIRDFFASDPEAAMRRAGFMLPWASAPAHFAVAYQMWSNGRRHIFDPFARCFACPPSRTGLNCVAFTCARDNEHVFPGMRYLGRLYAWVQTLAVEGRDEEIPPAVDEVYHALMIECEDPHVAAALRQTATELDLCRGCFKTIGDGDRCVTFPSIHLSCMMKYVGSEGTALVGLTRCHSRRFPVDPKNHKECNVW